METQATKQTAPAGQNSGHTPGPWRAHLNVSSAITAGHIIKQDDAVQMPIALVPKGGGFKGVPTQIANAHLIAAAPELLAMCKKQHRAMDALLAMLCKRDPEFFPTKCSVWPVMQGAHALIDQAEGATK